MIIALDVHYTVNGAKAVAVLFNQMDSKPVEVITTAIPQVEEYIPGQFYKRELPCLLQLLNNIDLSDLELLIIDGYVYTDNNHSPGLGAHLWEAINRKVPVAGVAKTRYEGNSQLCTEVYRGSSKNPLFISAIGIEMDKVAALIKDMHGENRIPTLLRTLDQHTKGTAL